MFSDFNEEEIDVYEKIGQKIKIRREIEKIDEKIEILKVKEEIDEKNLDDEINPLIERKKILQEEEDDLTDSEEYNSIIGKLDTFKELKIKLQKLETKKGTISDNVFIKLKQEYEGEYNKTELVLLKETERIQKLHEKLDSFIKNVDLLREEERLRFNLSEYTENQYNELLEKISQDEKRAESVLYATAILLEEFKNELSEGI